MMITAIFDDGKRFTAHRPHGLRFLGTLGPGSIAGYIIKQDEALSVSRVRNAGNKNQKDLKYETSDRQKQ